MILLIDVGNTNLKWALSDAAEGMTVGGVLSHVEVGEVGLIEQWQALSNIDQVVVASVAQVDFVVLLEGVIRLLWDLPLCVARVNFVSCGIKNAYHMLEQLGVDRWLAVIGARQVCDVDNLIVIDVGTAINIELLCANVYQGGAILPGTKLAHTALVGGAFGVESMLDKPKQVVGKSTVECVNSGVYFGLAGAVDRVVDEMQDVLPSPARVLMCGGGAETLSLLMRSEVDIEMNLVLRGLLEVAKCEF